MASASHPPDPSAPKVSLTSSKNNKRKSRPLTELEPPSPSGRSTPKSESRIGLGDGWTLNQHGTAQCSKQGLANSHSASLTSIHTTPHTTNPSHAPSNAEAPSIATSKASNQPELNRFLESEMQGAIFCDPNFVKNFLTVDPTRLQTVLDLCEDDHDAFVPPSVTQEPDLYEPIRRALNAIKEAVHSGPGQNAPPSLFDDVHSSPIPPHVPDTATIRPDLVLCDGPTRHWETVRMPIEVKTQPTYLKAGMKELGRYARAVFASQIHRRHLYGMVVCTWEATFVRFDRSGVLYSKPLDMSGEEFRKAFAGLMTLDDEGFGYDTAFTTRARRDRRLEYYVDLPAAAFPSSEGSEAAADTSIARPGPSNQPYSPPKPSTRRLKVVRTLCHRKTIRGREVARPGLSAEPEDVQGGAKTRSRKEREQRMTEEAEILGPRDYVLKLMWRDPNKRMEGEVLERLVGIYGVAQYMWHSDAFKACNTAGCAGTMHNSCGNCLDRTLDRDNVLVANNLTDLDIELPEEARDGRETKYMAVKTDEYSEAYAKRTPRIYCRLLMSTVGSSLCTAESPRHLLQAVLDAILGYWRLVNKGLLHRDISDGNVLMLNEDYGYAEREWRAPRSTAANLHPALAESERLLRELLDKLDRDPTGMLNDFDLFTTHNEMGAAFFGDSPLEDESDTSERRSKRRKLGPEVAASTPSSSSNKGKERESATPEESSLNRITEADKGACQGIDFRTGTPTFMSIRVLEVDAGTRYQHHFMDDLESFFWLILWCVFEHIDAVGVRPAKGAQEMLDTIDQADLRAIADGKRSLLFKCGGTGRPMRQILALCSNSWAADPGIISVVMKLGVYFFNLNLHEATLEPLPHEAFPFVFGVIMDALA
ncbi:hypothetical protein FRC10_000373 [Ceratobasidium sp. 414]|nr:hypothetical protein FRC10_000373 [Ceratobasidium sp. 414]